MPKVTIAIPTYNSEKFLEQTLKSILDQTYQDFEIIISDDNSNDNTKNIVDYYLEKYKNIKFFTNTNNLGLFANFNKCIEYAQGEYINIIGHDDVMLPRNIQMKCKILDNYPNVGLVASSIKCIDQYNNFITLGDVNWAKYEADSLEKGKEWIQYKASANNPICCPFVFLRRSTLEKSGFFSCEYPFVGDYEMWLRVAIFADIYFLNETLGYFRWHKNNESHKYSGLYYLTEVSQVWNSIINRLNLTERELNQIEIRILSGLYEYFVMDNLNNFELASKMCQILDQWRNVPIKISLVTDLLNQKIIEQNNQLIDQERQYCHKINLLQSENYSLKSTIKAMKSSKFWQLRQIWFQLKNLVSLDN
jgi:glycosyltransferase involved in cell wall biosynthesis